MCYQKEKHELYKGDRMDFSRKSFPQGIRCKQLVAIVVMGKFIDTVFLPSNPHKQLPYAFFVFSLSIPVCLLTVILETKKKQNCHCS
jgi:hypothetical protein